MDKYDERYRLKWVECKSKINYNAFKEGEIVTGYPVLHPFLPFAHTLIPHATFPARGNCSSLFPPPPPPPGVGGGGGGGCYTSRAVLLLMVTVL